MIAIAALDILFVYGFAGAALAIVLLGLRIAFLWTDPVLVSLITVLAVTSIAAVLLPSAWMGIDVSAHAATRRRSVWKRIVWRFPIVGPGAYYVAEYRPRVRSGPRWLVALTHSRRGLDIVADVAWYGALSGFVLMLTAFVAAMLQSSWLFLLVIILAAVLTPVSGAAFSILTIVVFMHAATKSRPSGLEPPWTIAPFVGIAWVRGIRQYYIKAVRPYLST